jgi:hypothetical protein
VRTDFVVNVCDVDLRCWPPLQGLGYIAGPDAPCRTVSEFHRLTTWFVSRDIIIAALTPAATAAGERAVRSGNEQVPRPNLTVARSRDVEAEVWCSPRCRSRARNRRSGSLIGGRASWTSSRRLPQAAMIWQFLPFLERTSVAERQCQSA